MLKSRWSTTMLSVLLWAGLAGVVFGQSTNSGDIRGVVSDSTGALVPDVTVTVLNINTGVTKEYSDEPGRCVLTPHRLWLKQLHGHLYQGRIREIRARPDHGRS